MRNKLSTAILIGALVAGHAGAIPITLGGLPTLREATLDSAVEGFAGSGNATAAIVDGYLASLAPWTEVGSVEPDTGGPGPYSQGLLDIVLLSGIWGDSPAAGTWAINSATFWTDHAEAAISLHVGNGGGEYDHSKAHRQGVSVPTWPGGPPVGLFETAEGVTIIPAGLSGERWRGEAFYGAALSTFGICYNMDRLADLGIEHPPARWLDLADPRYARQLGVADPTKSGSISKAFEMIIHQQCTEAVRAAGFSDDAIESYERRIGDARLAPGALPEGVPPSYQAAVEAGWVHGLRLVQLIGANARYFTDSAGRVPVDVSMGNAAAGLAIDFYGRFQAEKSRAPDGTPRMAYLTPKGGSSVSADPISLLRGAPNRETAVRFVEFVLGPEGQKLWNYAPGSPGGPDKFALRRLPIRRDFYPGAGVEGPAGPESHAAHSVDNLNDPDVNPYELAEHFTYRPRWTARHFALHRMLIRAMCLDAGEELRSAWQAIIAAGGPRKCERAMWAMQQLPDAPESLTWVTAHDVRKRHDDLELMREWTLFFRNQYREAERLAKRER